MKTESKGKIFLKRGVLFAALIIALSGAVYFNWQSASKTGSIAVSGAVTSKTGEKYLGDAKYVNATAQQTTANNYFDSAKQKREEDRKKSVNELKSIINNVKSDSDAKAKATEQMTKLTELSKNETAIETLITAKGFDDCVAVLSEKGANIVVKAKKSGLLDSETKQIQDIVMTNSDISLENIKIIEIK